jgi:hypothetical protein
MKTWQIVRLVAGIFILLSLALGVQGSPAAKCTDEVVPDGDHLAQAGRAIGLLIDFHTERHDEPTHTIGSCSFGAVQYGGIRHRPFAGLASRSKA